MPLNGVFLKYAHSPFIVGSLSCNLVQTVCTFLISGYRFFHSLTTKAQFLAYNGIQLRLVIGGGRANWPWQPLSNKISTPKMINNRHSNVGPIVILLGASAAAVGFKRFLPFVTWTCPPGSQVLSQVAIPRLMIDAGSIRLLIMDSINSGSFWISFLHFWPGD